MKHIRHVLLVLALVAAGLACSSAVERDENRATAQSMRDERLPLIEHVRPPRDSMGPAPTQFEWTPAAGADRYAIGLWTEIGTLVWRHDNVRATTVRLPEEIALEFGTYFWSVTALREDRAVAESGRAAFVVVR